MEAEARSARSRRAVLTGAAGLMAVGLCTAAGCGASGSPAAPGTAPASGAAASGAGPSGAVPSGLGPSGLGPSGAAAGVGSAGTRLGAASAVPVGGGTVYENLEVVVTQPEAGRFEGLSAVCTHTGCIVDKVANGLIECPCHGSRYHLDGTVAHGPAPRPLAPRAVTVVDGALVIA